MYMIPYHIPSGKGNEEPSHSHLSAAPEVCRSPPPVAAKSHWGARSRCGVALHWRQLWKYLAPQSKEA